MSQVELRILTMMIYVGHSSSYDYTNELYLPLRSSILWSQHTIILPHEHVSIVANSKKIILDCDVFVAEVSHPSTGLGIELGWAEAAGCKIVCMHKEGLIISKALDVICVNYLIYTNSLVMIQLLTQLLNEMT